MQNSAILNSRLYPRIGFDNASKVNKSFENNSQFKGNLAEQLLLYDNIIFPTNDFGIVSILNNWLGPDMLREALENEVFSFVRSKGIMAYFNQGNGINFIIARESPDKKFLWWQHAMFGDFEKAIELQLSNSTDLKKDDIAILLPLVLARSKEIKFDSGYYKKDFAKETYQDIQENPLFNQYFFNYYNIKNGKLDLLDLPSIQKDEGRISSLLPINDPIDLMLRLAETNLEIAISSFLGGVDIFTSLGANQLMATKLKRLGYTPDQIDGFLTLLDLNSIPDIEAGITKNILSFEDIWHFRNSKKSKEFRKWLREINSNDLREIERIFVASITKESIVDKLPSKVLRFCVTTVAGIINPIFGLLASAADNFAIDKLKGNYNPKLFFDHLRKLNMP